MDLKPAPLTPLRRVSARGALTLLYLALFIPLLIVFGVALELWLRHELREEFHRELRQEADRLVEHLNREARKSAQRADLGRSLGPLLAFNDHPAWVADQIGTVAGSAPPDPTLLDERVVRDLQGGLVLHVAANMPPGDAIHEFRRAALGALVLTLLLAGGGGYALSAIVLRPVGAIAGTLEEIDARSLHSRLPERPVRDELGRLVETINRMLGRIEQGVAAHRRFAEDLSHELKTPLAAIRGSVEVAMHEKARKPADLEWALDVTLRELERLERLVGDLLVLVRSEAHTLVRRQPGADLCPVLREVAEIGNMLANEQGGRLDAVVSETPLTVDGDPGRIRQVALNLVDNAIKHGRPQGTVWFRCAREKGDVRIVVEDDGLGVPPEARERVFERFFRLPSDEKGEGMGLGLAIARAIVQEHGGSIVVEEREGGGARFIVRLPATGREPS